MGEKDLAHNDYFSDRHRFADVCNGILFQGREVIRPEELEEAEQDIIYMSDDGRHKIIPDKVRIWNGVVCLYDMLNISEELKPYITNYKMNLFDYHNYDDFSFFKTENRELFEVLSCARSETKMKSLLYGNEDRYRRLPGNAAETIFDIAGINRKLLEKIFDNGKEVVDMCKAWDDHIETGRREGRREMQAESVKNLMESLKISAGQAMDYLKVAENDREECLALLG